MNFNSINYSKNVKIDDSNCLFEYFVENVNKCFEINISEILFISYWIKHLILNEFPNQTYDIGRCQK